MSARDFLVELGTEELPPKALNTLANAFRDGITRGLKAAGLSHGQVKVYAAPRRLAVWIGQLAERQDDRSQALDGPPVQAAFDDSGEPTKAALGFARKCGVDISEIDRSGAKLRFEQQKKRHATLRLLPDIVKETMSIIHVTTRMR